MKRWIVTLVLAGGTVAAAPLDAQARGGKADGVPPGARPPAGMCRIWIDGVPPGQQPAPTDCATALRNRPANARVLFGDDYASPGKGKGKVKVNAFNREDRARDDADEDERADAAEYPRTLPEMMGAVLAARGQPSADVARWLGAGRYAPRYEDARGRAPDRVTWLDAAGRVAQVWIDANHDGRADRVEVYRGGKLVRVIQ
jgi:hypothetical protein